MNVWVGMHANVSMSGIRLVLDGVKAAQLFRRGVLELHHPILKMGQCEGAVQMVKGGFFNVSASEAAEVLENKRGHKHRMSLHSILP